MKLIAGSNIISRSGLALAKGWMNFVIAASYNVIFTDYNNIVYLVAIVKYGEGNYNVIYVCIL